MGVIDAGRAFRTKRFEGIDILMIPRMTTTTIFIVHRPSVKIYRNVQFQIIPHDEPAYTFLYQLVCGYNIVVHNPNRHATLTNKTA
jgi:hypothetical protein